MAKRKREAAESEETTAKASKAEDELVNDKKKAGTTKTRNDISEPEDDIVQSFTVESKGKEVTCERRGGNAKPSLIFTHGAGGGLFNPATKEFAEGFAEVSPIVSFKGNMNMQSRVNGFQAVIKREDTQLALGGRSMGARAAVMTAQQPDLGITALILVSYPLVGAQKGDTRDQILLDLPENIDVLFISGSKDSMCDMQHLRKVIGKMQARCWVVGVQGADHGMSLAPKTAIEAVRKQTGIIAAQWLLHRDETKRNCSLHRSKADGKVVATGWQNEVSSSEVGSASIKDWAKPVK